MDNNSTKTSRKTSILSVGDSFKDYVLFEVYPKYVIFTKGDKEYKLSLDGNNYEQKISKSKMVYTASNITQTQQVATTVSSQSNIQSQDIEIGDNNSYEVKQTLIQHQ